MRPKRGLLYRCIARTANVFINNFSASYRAVLWWETVSRPSRKNCCAVDGQPWYFGKLSGSGGGRDMPSGYLW